MHIKDLPLRAPYSVFVRFGSCAIEFCTLVFLFCKEIFYGRITKNIYKDTSELVKRVFYNMSVQNNLNMINYEKLNQLP